MLNFVIFLRDPCIFSLLQFCQKCLILSFSERPVHFFQFFNFLSKMVHFVIFETWTSNYEISIKEYYVYTMCCDISNYFVKNAQFCHFLRGPCIFSLLQFCQKCLILSFFVREETAFFSLFQFCQKCHFVIFETWTSNYEISISILLCVHYVLSLYQTILSKMLNFVILWETRVFFSLLQFCQKCLILSFCERPVHFFNFSILSKMVHFVIFETRTSNYEISIKEYYVYTMCCDISNYFVKNAQFCHFLRGPCSFFTFSKLSKIAHFVTFWEAHVFFRFINCVKNAQFCHFLRGQCIFSHFQFCQKWSILSFLKSGLQIMR